VSKYEDTLRSLAPFWPEGTPEGISYYQINGLERDALADLVEAVRKDAEAEGFCVACRPSGNDSALAGLHTRDCPITRLDRDERK
jgi:hypothetical protein